MNRLRSAINNANLVWPPPLIRIYLSKYRNEFRRSVGRMRSDTEKTVSVYLETGQKVTELEKNVVF